MIVVNLVLAFLLGSAPSDSDLLKYKVSGKTLMSKCSVDTPSSKVHANSDQPGWVVDVGLLGTFDESGVSGTVWDNSRLFPGFLANDHDKQLRVGAIALQNILSSVKDSFDPYISNTVKSPHHLGEGFNVNQFPQLRSSFLSTLGTNVNGLALNDDSVFSIKLDTFVCFNSSDGREEVFQLKGASEGGNIRGLDGLSTVDGGRRVNRELLALIGDSRIQLPRGRVAVSKLLTVLGDFLHVPLRADRRVHDIVLFIDPSGTTVSVRDLVLGLADSLDMYWRSVDGLQFLSISPEDPRTLQTERYRLETARILAPLLEKAGSLGLLPSGLTTASVMSSGYQVGSLGSDCIKSLLSSMVFRSDLDRQRWDALSQDQRFQNGTIRFRVVGTSFVDSKAGQYSVGGLAWRLDGD